MSYAQAAAQGANQSPEEARAPIPPKIHSSPSSSLVDVDSPHVSTVPSDYESQSVKTSTQAERISREREAAEARSGKSSSPDAGRAGARSRSASKKKKKEKAKESVHEAKEEAKEKAKAVFEHGEERAEGAWEKLLRNKSNPVVVANALLICAASGAVGYHAYQRHLKGMLTWEMVGAWSGGIGLVAGLDYLVSRWLLQNKYPPK